MTDRHPLYSHLSINTHSPPTGNVLTCKEGYQRENGRKHVGDKGKCCPWYFRAPMSINRALGKKAGNQQSEASSRNFFWGAAIRDLTPSCLGRLTATCHVIPHHMRVDIDRGRPDWGIGYTDLSAVRSTFVACFESKELVPKDLQQQVGFRYLKLGVHFYWKRRRNKKHLVTLVACDIFLCVFLSMSHQDLKGAQVSGRQSVSRSEPLISCTW